MMTTKENLHPAYPTIVRTNGYGGRLEEDCHTPILKRKCQPSFHNDRALSLVIGWNGEGLAIKARAELDEVQSASENEETRPEL